jgi:hypothetical protein
MSPLCSVLTLNVIMLSVANKHVSLLNVTNKPFMNSVVMHIGIILSVANNPFMLNIIGLSVMPLVDYTLNIGLKD